jgi:hypothetical protein
MAHCTGSILDVFEDANRAIIWIKTLEGQTLNLFGTYERTLYALPKDEDPGAESVRKIDWANKFTDLFDRRMKRLICTYPKPVFTTKHREN